MTLPNGRMSMRDSLTPSTLSPKSFPATNGFPQSVTSSTIDNASLDELDRIMNTLSTLSRDASLAKGPNDGKRYTLSSSPSSERTGQRSFPTGSESTTSFSSTTPYSATSPTTGLSAPNPTPIPPPLTSPPQTPVAQSPRRFSANPKVMTMSVMPSHHPYDMTRPNNVRNPATIPRLPSNPYENTSILHGSHIMRPSNFSSSGNVNPFPAPPKSPYVNKNPNTHGSNSQFFFGPLPVSPQEAKRYPIPTGPNTSSIMSPHSVPKESNPDRNQMPPQNNRGDSGHPHHGADTTGRGRTARKHSDNAESQIQPPYDDKRSHLKNIEQGTLPRSGIDAGRLVTPKNVTPNLGRRLSKKKPSLSDETGEALNRLWRPTKSDQPKRAQGRAGLYNMSKTPSRHSTTSFNSFDMGRGYASVSTAPASTHGLIQHEVLPHRKKSHDPSPLVNPDSPRSGEGEKEENCCMTCGRFLYSHMLELFILVAFCAGLPVGIVIQATGSYSTPSFQRYFGFWGSTMLPMVLSTITPLLIISSMLTGMGNLTPNVLNRLIGLSSLYYAISTFAAVCVAVAFSLLIKPGSSAIINGSATVDLSGRSAWLAGSLRNLSQERSALPLHSFNQGSVLYDTSGLENVTVTDEIFLLLRLFFPGCGSPSSISDTEGICNVFTLALIAGVVGIGASVMGAEGAPMRHVLFQVGTMMSNMADILLWYVPVGVFFYISELVAAKIDWMSIGKVPHAAENFTDATDGVRLLNDATKWFIITVSASIGIYCLVLLPVVAGLITLSNPLSFLGFRSLAPLLTSVAVGLSDICIPLTLRSLVKGRGFSKCCKPQEKVDRRIARVSAVLGGVFHRAGSAIVLTCSAIFLLQVYGKEISFLAIVQISVSAMVTSVVSLGGRWFHGTDPFVRATVISLSTTGATTPAEIPVTIFSLWLLCRFAAFTDTIIDLLATRIFHKVCRSKLRDVAVAKDESKNEASTNSSDTDCKIRERSSPMNKMTPASGETSDYEDAPLLFSRALETGNESSSVNSRNDDSVFLPNRPQESRSNQQTNALQRPRTNVGMTNPVVNNRDEVSFVTF